MFSRDFVRCDRALRSGAPRLHSLLCLIDVRVACAQVASRRASVSSPGTLGELSSGAIMLHRLDLLMVGADDGPVLR